MKVLTDLLIGSYRGLAGVEFKEFGLVNLLLGVNNSGKTSVIEALSLLSDPLDPLNWVSTASSRDIRLSPEERERAVRWLFPRRCAGETTDTAGPRHEPIRLSDGNEQSGRWLEATCRPVSGVGNGEADHDADAAAEIVQQGCEITVRASEVDQQRTLIDRTRTEVFTVWSDAAFVSPTSAKSTSPVSFRVISPISHRMEKMSAMNLSKVIADRRQDDLNELLRVFDPDIEQVELLSPGGSQAHVFIRHRRLGLAPLQTFGDGLRRILSLAMAIVEVGHRGILLVDEIETSIHVEALRKAFHWLITSCRAMKVQLFATTHSLEAIDAIISGCETKDHLVAFRLPSVGSGKPVVRLLRQELITLRNDLGLEVRW